MELAAEYEIKRQKTLAEKGETWGAETRGWKTSEEKTKVWIDTLTKNGMTVAAPSGVTFKDELVAMLAHHSANQPLISFIAKVTKAK